MKKESVFVMLFVLFVLGGSGNIVPACAAVMGGGGGPGTPCEDMDIILIMDCSGSMSIMDAEVGGSTVSRMDAAKVAAKDFIDLLPTGTNTRVGVVSYESYGTAGIKQPLTTAFTDAKTVIDGLSAGAMTAMTAIGDGLEKGRDELAVNGTTNRRVFLLLTDGIANSRPPGWTLPAGWVSPPGTWNVNELYAFVEAHDAMTLDVTNPTNIYTVGMGDQTKIHEYFLEVLAHSSGGEYFYAGTTAVSEMFGEVRADICYGDIRVLILSNLDRMDDLGMDPASSDLVSELQDLADNNPNERGVVVDLGDLCDPSSVEYNALIDTAYSDWDGNEGDVTLTNALVDAIDDYIEDLKHATYPLMRYVIIVGSHEVIPMEARPDDYSFVIPTMTYNERQWADDSLPLTSGYLYDIYHTGADGHYMTDTPYSDLSYLDTSADHELTPELSVSRLVETPQQIVDVIDTYMAASGIIPRNHFVSIASNDYLDGGTLANDYMTATGVTTNDSLVQCSYSSADVPPLLNAEHDVVYFAGHGEYNVISTGSGSFMAGNSATQGDTDDTDSVDGAVIITSGCHNGVNFGNTLYHAPDAGTTYSEFPEEFAENGVVAYIGATGYTVISPTDCSTTASSTGYNEKLATNVVYYTVNCVDIGRAFRNGANDYYREASPIQDYDRRVLAIPTLYGIPTYRDPVTPESAQAPGMTPAAGTDVTRTGAAAGLSEMGMEMEIVTVNVSDYIVESSGIVAIPGVDQVVSFNEPILPLVFAERTFPRGAAVSVEWLKKSSECIVVKNNVPIAGIACGNASIPGKFYYKGFWPPQLHRSYQFLTFGAGGSKVGFGVYPVQYNPATGETKIWTMLKFGVNYRVPPTGISIVSLCPDKPGYSLDDTVRLNTEIFSSRHTSLMNLGVVMRDMDTGKEIATSDIGRIGLKGGTTTGAWYSVDLGSIPPNLLEGRTVAAELIVSDSHNGDILASMSFEFEVAGKSKIFFSTEEDFVMQGPKPHDGNPIISDGDLLCSDGTIIARNRELLKAFETEFDLGLDASDVITIDTEERLVAFSTELDDPNGQFTAGDLLTTTGAAIPNIALLAMFDIPKIDLGLDAVHFTGDLDGIIKFLEYIADEDADVWREDPEMLSRVLEECDIDIWFSTEGTAPKPGDPLFLDGDLLSARYGTIVARNSELLPASVPAGILDRGVDFGLDAATADRTGNARLIRFSTEILYGGKLDFTDGDVLRINNGVVCTNNDLIDRFEPRASFLGLDALSIAVEGCEPSISVKKVVRNDAEPVWADEITAYVGDTLTFKCAIHNDGCYSLYGISARDVLPDILKYTGDATVNGEPCKPDLVEDTELEWFFEGPLDPSETITIEYGAYVVEHGEGANIHTAKAICEETGEVVNGKDGASISTVPHMEAPDLVITGIEGVGSTGKPLNIAYTIENQGNAIAGTSYTGLYIDGEYVMKDHVDSLEPGGVIEGSFDYLWECEAGDKAEIEVCADIADQVTENDESNNCITEVWTCEVPLPIGLDIYFADATESPGSVYHYDTDSGTEDIIYTRPSKRLYSFAFHPKIPEKLYYVNANEYKIYRTHQISTGWVPEEVVYTHDTYIRDIAFAFDSDGEPGLYFSEATGAGEDGKIYRIESDNTATLYYTVKLADVDGSWAGDFAFDAKNNPYLSSGNRVPARIYKVDDERVEEIYKDEKESIKGLVCEDGALYYANWRTKIYRLDTDTGERTVVYSNPKRGWLSDVGFR